MAANKLACELIAKKIIACYPKKIHQIGQSCFMKKKISILLFFLMSSIGHAQSNLPACKGDDIANWTNCFGTEVRTDGKKRQTYVGEFKNGEFHGKGKYSYESGDSYEGDYRNGLQHGRGTYKLSNGEKYVGEYKNDKRHGSGEFYSSNGNLLKSGRWHQGKFVDNSQPVNSFDINSLPHNQQTAWCKIIKNEMDVIKGQKNAGFKFTDTMVFTQNTLSARVRRFRIETARIVYSTPDHGVAYLNSRQYFAKCIPEMD